MQGEPGLPLPSSLEEVEALILALYEPGPPETIAKIQDVLQRVQKSPEGWQLAQSLLVNTNDKIKFFGALTIIVKLNTESSTLSQDDADELLQNLVGWFVLSVRDGSSPLVTKKLCSALATCFIHFPMSWPSCIAHLVHCLYTGCSVPVSEARDDDVDATVGLLDFAGLRAGLWFASTLVEEVSKTDPNSQKYALAHDELITEGHDVACLISRGIEPGFTGTDCTDIQAEAIRCLQPWIMYNQRISSSTDSLTPSLRTLLAPTIRCLLVDELYEASAELLTDTLSNYSSFFTSESFDMLINLFDTSWSENRYQALIQGDFDFDSVQFGLLMVAFGEANIINFQQSTSPRSQRFLAGLAGLLAASGYAVAEDKIFVPALEFWAAFVEIMADKMYSEEAEDSWVQYSLSMVMQVVGNCFKKVQFPPAAVFSTWDSSERASFIEARKDVADLLQTVYTILGNELVSLFVDLLLQALSAKSWAELEATAFCLSVMADCIPEAGECDGLLNNVFSSGLFDLLNEGEKLPVRLRQTGLSLIEHFSDYFERHEEFLPGALNLLFSAVSDPVLAGPSAKSICTLCSSCRSHLMGEAPTFISYYERIHSSRSIDPVAEEKIVTAIASVIQAIPDENTRLEAFRHLFNIIKVDVSRCLQLKMQPESFEMTDPLLARYIMELQSRQQELPSADKIAGQIAVQSLRYCLSMAKGLQALSDGLVDLDAPSNGGLAVGELLPQVQSEIMQMIVQLQTSFPDNGELIETICLVLRAGFSETEPGPFVFPADIVTQYLTNLSYATTPRIGYAVSTACAFTSSLASSSREEAAKQLAKILPWAIDLLQSLTEPEADSELSQNIIELVTRVAQRQPEVLMRVQPSSLLELFFVFSLKVLDGRETLPKSAAAEFWSTFLMIKTTDEHVRHSVDNVMTHLGPLLAASLIRNVSGNAARSELDRLSEPLKKLVTQNIKAKTWLEAALADISFPSARVSPEEKSTFLKKLLNLRGSRQTNQVVRDFWLACRGSSFAYAS